MANAAEKLFDQVVSQLPADDGHSDPKWPSPDFEDETVPPGELNEFGVDMIVPYSHVETANRVINRMESSPSDLEPSREDKELVEGGIRELGLEALAFYKSRRLIHSNPFPGKWGIFYLKHGLMHIGWEISQAYPGYKDPRILAHDFLFAHEHFHFRADMQTLLLEATLRRHLYLPVHRAIGKQRTHFVEEALANKQVYDWAKKRQIGLREYAFDFMSIQPNAYARFSEPEADLAGEWAANIVDLLPPGCPPRYDLAPWVEATPTDFLRRSLCPEYVIYLARLDQWLSPAWVPPPVNEIDESESIRMLLENRSSQISSKWQETKRKLLENRTLRGLNFKKWPKGGTNVYSVRVDDNHRAHMRHQGQGRWQAFQIGSHKEMGHG